MSFPTNWNVEKYYNPTEPSQHWLLKKHFIETHKNKYPEQELVCLTSVFYNMEFLNCSYNIKVSNRINELARQVDSIVEYRRQRANKLQRTFVRASDAVKTGGARYNAGNKDLPFSKQVLNPTRTINQCDIELLKRAQKQSGWMSKLVLFELTDSQANNPVSTCAYSISRCHMEMLIKRIGDQESNEYHMLIDKEPIATCQADSKKQARAKLCAKALVLFKKYCFTLIMASQQYRGVSEIEPQTITKKDVSSLSNPPLETDTKRDDGSNFNLPPDNIGIKMMKLMGWSGQGLGKEETGIREPIQTSAYRQRFGLGVINKSTSDFQSNIQYILKTYIENGNTHVLIFSKDFTKEDRKLIHEIALQYKLKTTSYGSKAARHLTIQKTLTPWQIVEELLTAGGTSANYTLIKPTML